MGRKILLLCVIILSREVGAASVVATLPFRPRGGILLRKKSTTSDAPVASARRRVLVHMRGGSNEEVTTGVLGPDPAESAAATPPLTFVASPGSGGAGSADGDAAEYSPALDPAPEVEVAGVERDTAPPANSDPAPRGAATAWEAATGAADVVRRTLS
eukprot:CAMPEP_0194338796 /NCGR_PEP_ID=MMETSP0171-20130528/80784_1 /TAXON_ID=218684 /ORGANISM="Corethron pennatum, Strain L29A3" /LENGTH=157 /DNA_ID=CAMNT_0039103069 /DNA_START=87 /DNA_END=557 /DNA_ORIENTATION=-